MIFVYYVLDHLLFRRDVLGKGKAPSVDLLLLCDGGDTPESETLTPSSYRLQTAEKTLHYRRPTSSRPRTRVCDRTPGKFLSVIKFRFPVLKYGLCDTEYECTLCLLTLNNKRN